MKITGIWVQVIGAVVTAVLAMLKLPAPLNDIVKQILDALLNNPQVAGLSAVSAGFIGYGLYKYQPKSSVERAAERAASAKADLEAALAIAGVESAALGQLSADMNRGMAAACVREARRLEKAKDAD